MIERYKKISTIKRLVTLTTCPECKQKFNRNRLIIKGEVDDIIFVEAYCENHKVEKKFDLAIDIKINGITPKQISIDDLLDLKINLNNISNDKSEY